MKPTTGQACPLCKGTGWIEDPPVENQQAPLVMRIDTGYHPHGPTPYVIFVRNSTGTVKGQEPPDALYQEGRHDA